MQPHRNHVAEIGSYTASQEAFDLAWKEAKMGRRAALRAHFLTIDDLRFDKCEMCEEIGFLQRSGLKGWTCTKCEQAHHDNLKGDRK